MAVRPISKNENLLQTQWSASSKFLDETIRCILICHDVLRIKGKMSGSSQDELVMMEMIENDYNCSFIVRDSSSIKIKMRGKEETYEIL